MARAANFIEGDWVRPIGWTPFPFIMGRVHSFNYNHAVGYMYKVESLHTNLDRIERMIFYEEELEDMVPTEEELLLWTTARLE